MQQEMAVTDFDHAIEDDVGDDLLRLVFIACHPVLSSEARVALTLRLLGRLSTDEIARAFLVPEPTIAQRIVRAKRTLAEQHIPFEVPAKDDLAPASRPFSRLSTSYSMRGTRLLHATTGRGPPSVKRRSASAVYSPSSRRRRPKFTASWP